MGDEVDMSVNEAEEPHNILVIDDSIHEYITKLENYKKVIEGNLI